MLSSIWIKKTSSKEVYNLNPNDIDKVNLVKENGEKTLQIFLKKDKGLHSIID